MPKRGRKFSFECDMTVPARNWLEFAGFRTKDEFRTPWGICDLVGVKLSRRYIESRQSLRQLRPVGNIKRVALLESMRGNQGFASSEIARRTGELFTPDELGRELRQLQTNHFLNRTEGGLYTRKTPASADENYIVAVEIKLDKIEEVLSQARANLAFAHKSYVGLPKQVAERLSLGHRANELETSGVGLLSVERGVCEVLIESAGDERRINPAVRAHCIERFWATFIDNASSTAPLSAQAF